MIVHSQELAIAFSFGKPVVPLILDQEAWDLLTAPGGAVKAKAIAAFCSLPSADADPEEAVEPEEQQTCAPAANGRSRCYTYSKFGPALTCFEGEEIVPDEPLSLAVVRKIFSRLAAINLCPCHDQQIQEKGLEAVLETAGTYVRQELLYTKQHAELALLTSKGTHLNGKDAEDWRDWLQDARANLRDPQPTQEQEAFVKRAGAAAGRRRTALTVLAVVVLGLIIAGAVASGVFAVESRKQAREALEQRVEAERQKAEAELQAELALKLSTAAWAIAGIRRCFPFLSTENLSCRSLVSLWLQCRHSLLADLGLAKRIPLRQ